MRGLFCERPSHGLSGVVTLLRMYFRTFVPSAASTDISKLKSILGSPISKAFLRDEVARNVLLGPSAPSPLKNPQNVLSSPITETSSFPPTHGLVSAIARFA